MTATAHTDSRGHAPAPPARAAALRGGTLALGVAIAFNGAALMLLALLVTDNSLQSLLAAGAGALVLVPGLLMIRTGLGRTAPTLGVLPGDVVLAGSLLYLGFAMPIFHDSHLSYSAGVSQFLGVLAGLTLGTAALALSGALTPQKRFGVVDPAAAVRNGVILIVGTIMVAIALTQLGLAKLTPPMWNWISFLAITIPGMLFLVAREFVKQFGRSRGPDGRPSLFVLVVTEAMLFGGLWVMIYGSGANLILGKNGFATGFKGNMDGLILVVAAVIFITVVRGILPQIESSPRILRAILHKMVYAVGLIPLIYGERAIVMGKSPQLAIGDASPIAIVILGVGLVVLIAGRIIGAGRSVGGDGSGPDTDAGGERRFGARVSQLD